MSLYMMSSSRYAWTVGVNSNFKLRYADLVIGLIIVRSLDYSTVELPMQINPRKGLGSLLNRININVSLPR